MKLFRCVLIFALAFCFLGEMDAQSSRKKRGEVEDVVYLTNGSILRGTIIAYDLDVELTLLLPNGIEVKVPAKRIEKVIQLRYGKTKKVKNEEYAFKERGVYNATMFHLSPGRTADNNPALGISLYHSTGFQFNRFLGIGGGIGVDSYNVSQFETVYPLYAEARGYFLSNWSSPFYSVATGYGFAFRNQDNSIIAARGGFFAHPSVGYRLSAKKTSNWTWALGMKFQNAQWTRQIWNGQEVQTMWYKRVTLKVGLIF